MSRAAAALLAAAAALALTACSEKREQLGATGARAIAVALDRPPGPEHVGFYQALAAGHFEEAGLEVELRAPSEQSPPIGQLSAGEADLAIVEEREVFVARERGTDAIAIAVLDQPHGKPVDAQGVPIHSKLVLVALGERITEDPEPIRLLVGALARGTRAAVEDPGPGLKELLTTDDGERKPSRRRLQLARRAARSILPTLVPRSKVKPFGYIDPGQWKEYAGWLRDNGEIDTPAEEAAAEAATDSLLPGADLD